jgi:chemotaxis protein CheD
MQRETKAAFAFQQLETVPGVTIDTNVAPKVEEVRVDMAEMKVDSKPVELLTSVGSCVAICIHDPVHKCGGLAHIMLPQSSNAANEPLPSKYADTAVPALLKALHKINGERTSFLAKIAGGANMFANVNAVSLDIGGKNVKAVKTVLEKHRIRLAGEDVGGSHGRRIAFNVVSGMATVKSFNGEIRKI